MAGRIKCIEIRGSNANMTKSKTGVKNITIPIINIKLLTENLNYEICRLKFRVGELIIIYG